MLGSIGVTFTIDAASTSPSSIAPVSPMKILAGWKLCGRNPAHMPMSSAVITAVLLIRVSWMSHDSAIEYANVAIPAIATMPAASPSSPSTKFTALMLITTMRMVTTAWSVLSRL